MEQIAPLGGAPAWTGDDLRADESGWRRPLGHNHIAEIEAALRHARAAGVPWHQITRADFPLATLGAELEAVGDELENGRGVIQLKGVPVAGKSPDENKVMFMGLSSWLGTPVYQSARGEILGEIRDEGPDVGLKRGQMTNPDGTAFLSSRSRAQSTQPLRWHTDRTDIVGLLCVGAPAEGGASRLSSAVAIHDAMVRRRPDLAALLYEPIWRSRLGEEADGGESIYGLPVFTVKDGKFASHYSRTYVEAAQKLPTTPQMTAAQWEALDMLAQLGDEFCYEMYLDPGDMQFLNNHVVYHARAAFRDDPEAGKVRNLYRIWLAARNGRDLPGCFAELFGDTVGGHLRGGILQAENGAVRSPFA
jgi:hypothetical protein